MTYLTITPDGLIYCNTVYVGHVSTTKTGEKYLNVRDGYCMSSQVLLELKHLLDSYGGE